MVASSPSRNAAPGFAAAVRNVAQPSWAFPLQVGTQLHPAPVRRPHVVIPRREPMAVSARRAPLAGPSAPPRASLCCVDQSRPASPTFIPALPQCHKMTALHLHTLTCGWTGCRSRCRGRFFHSGGHLTLPPLKCQPLASQWRTCTSRWLAGSCFTLILTRYLALVAALHASLSRAPGPPWVWYRIRNSLPWLDASSPAGLSTLSF